MYVLDTPCGKIQGTKVKDGIVAYKGIRYATAKRWEYPTVVESWEGVYDASNYGPCAYQPRAFYDEKQMPEKAFYYNEFRKEESFTYSEDCLFLNIFTPETVTENLPVLVYIHGGGFTGGSSNEKPFDGPVWPRHGVIGVTINYRLGPLGFMCLPELKEESGHTGNYALFDQLAALQWIKKNIRAFGGDPERITIMGQSAGAMSVQQLCFSPLLEGLFKGAVLSSGAGVSEMMSAPKPELNYPFWSSVKEASSCTTLEAFRTLDIAKLFEVWMEVKKKDKRGAMGNAPVLDGICITETGVECLKHGHQMNIPYMMGTTSEDMMPPILYKMSKDYCRKIAGQGKEPGYMWFFDRKLPGDENGAWHSSDLWYWFGTFENCWRPMTEKDQELSETMVQYLMNFVKTGNPNGENTVQWLPIQKGQAKVLRIGEGNTRMGGVNVAKLTHTMLTNKVVGE